MQHHTKKTYREVDVSATHLQPRHQMAMGKLIPAVITLPMGKEPMLPN
jgi:hypothetical protein